MKTNLRNLTIVGLATVIVAGSAQATTITRPVTFPKTEAQKPLPKSVNGFWQTAAGSKSKSLAASVVKRTQPLTLPAAILPPSKFKPNAITVVTPPSLRPSVSVPDGGTTSAMLGMTLIGLALLKKKDAFRTRSLAAS